MDCPTHEIHEIKCLTNKNDYAWCSWWWLCAVTGCGHCKKAKPEFMQAAEKMKDDTKVSGIFQQLDFNLGLLLYN